MHKCLSLIASFLRATTSTYLRWASQVFIYTFDTLKGIDLALPTLTLIAMVIDCQDWF